jgi:hypothetical protein
MKTAGHLGISRTLDKIKRRYFWFGMRRDIMQYVRSCADCETKKKPLERPKGFLAPIRAQQPFENLESISSDPYHLQNQETGTSS